MPVRLRITAGKGAGRDFVFTQKVVKIGRMPDNDLVLYDTGVSRYHCEIVQDGATFALRDLQSANGTLVNDQLATEAELHSGDVVSIGPITFSVTLGVKKLDPLPEEDSDRGVVAEPESAAEKADLEQSNTSALLRPTPPPHEVQEMRTSTGSFKALKESPRRLPRSTRIAIASAAGVLVLAVVVSLVLHLNRPQTDRSGEVFKIDKANFKLSFGNGNVDVLAADKAQFTFTSQRGHVVLGYAVAGIGSPTEVEIVVNGERVGYAPQTSRGWASGLSLVVPRRLLRAGQNNVTFDNTLIPSSTPDADLSAARWGVGAVTVLETPLPKPDLAKAKQLYDLGRAAYDTRSVAPQNLNRAIEYLDEALLLVEGVEPEPPLLAQIVKGGEDARRELQTTFEAHIFAAEQALRFGDVEQARDALRDVMRYFPNPEDPRHQRAKERLAELTRRGNP
jgi:pSer/pThr/pTyr-binding forkhead associated (FHA) protein